MIIRQKLSKTSQQYNNLNQMDLDLDNIIDFLNIGGGMQMREKKVKKKEKNKGSKQIGPQQVEQKPLDLQDQDSIENFEEIYEKRLMRIQHKNHQRQEEEKKKKELQEIAKQKYASKNPVVTDENFKLPTIRYLLFKNWSGNHLQYEVKDHGYKFRFTNGVVGLVKHLLEENGFVESTDNDGTILWNIGVPSPSVYQSMGAYMKINHFPKSYEITRKDLMLQNLSKMKSKYPSHYCYFPNTYILPAEVSNFFEDCQKQKHNYKWYIVKPHNKSQGRGIWLTNHPEEIIKRQKQCIVVSQYIHNPLLVNGLKFDMRIYVAVTCMNPLRIYIYDDGLARFATSEYKFEVNSQDNLYAHLTNYSLNKNSENFVPNDDAEDHCVGHKWSLPALKDFLRKSGYDVDLIWNRIEDMIIKTIISVENTIYHAMEMSVPCRDNCFEVLGFDILIDDNLRPWLLEINLSPSLNTDSALDLKIKGNMLADLFSMIGIVSKDQRFSADKTYLLNSNKMFQHKEYKNQWSKLEKLILKESEQQLKRSGDWKRIFPTQTAIRYKPFFDVDRPLNRLLRDQELKKVKNQKNINYNQALKTINENPQNQKKKK